MLKIKDFATLCGCSIYTLRYYDQIALLQPAVVNHQSGYRYYSEDQVLRYQEIRDFQEIGFSVHEIKEMSDMSNEEIVEKILDKMANLNIRFDKSIILLKRYMERWESMKKLISLGLCLVILLGMSGCSSGNSGSGSSSSSSTFVEPFSTSATIEETVLVDQNDVKITAKSLTFSSSVAKLNVSIENNRSEKIEVNTLYGIYDWNSINGYMLNSTYMDCEVEANQTVDDSIEIYLSELEIMGIKSIADIKLSLTVINEDYDTIYEGMGYIKTSEYDSYDYTKDYYLENIDSTTLKSQYEYTINMLNTDNILEQNDIKILSTVIMTNSSDDVSMLIEVQNGADYNLYVKVKDFYFNDILVSDEYDYDVNGVASQTIGLVDSDLTDYLEYSDEDVSSIVTLNKLKFTLELLDSVTETALYSTDIEFTNIDVPLVFESEES